VFNLHSLFEHVFNLHSLFEHVFNLHSLSVQVFNLHSICTGVQPTLLYLYTCSTYSLSVHVFNLHSLSVHVFNLHSLSVQVFNLHFTICIRVQPTIYYLYRCSTYSICTGVQPTLLSTAVSTSFTPKWEKPKELRNLEQLILSFLGDQNMDFAVMLNLVGVTSCIWTL